MRNIILFSGPIAVGKTELIKYLKEVEFTRHNIPFDPTLTTDSTFLVNAVMEDHEQTQGMHHVHAPDQLPVAHPLNIETEHLNFINVSPVMQQRMHKYFTDAVSKLPDDGKFHFAEMAVGVNKTAPDLLTARNDYSCHTIVERFQQGLYDSSWMNRIAGVFHITSEYTLRVVNNNKRLLRPYEKGQDENGEQSRPLPHEVLLFTKEDDFHYLEEYLRQEHGLDGRITIIHNNGTQGFFTEGSKIVLEHIHREFSPEGKGRGKENI